MQTTKRGFTNLASAPTEETLSAAGIREIVNQSIRVEEGDPKFLYCIKASKLSTYFCLSSVPIRKGLFIIATIESLIAAYALLWLLTTFLTEEVVAYNLMFYYRFVQALGIIEGLMCVIAGKRLDTRFAKMCYHWKIWEVIIVNVMEVMWMFSVLKNGETLPWGLPTYGYLLYVAARCLVRAAYGLYVTYTIYSFIILIDKKANINLVLYGPDVVKLMENIRKQAAAMEMRTEQLSEMEMTTVQHLDKKELAAPPSNS